MVEGVGASGGSIGIGELVTSNLNTACNNIDQIPKKHTLNTTTFAQDFGRRPGCLGSSCHQNLVENRKKNSVERMGLRKARKVGQ